MLSPPAFSFPTKVLLLAEMNRKIKEYEGKGDRYDYDSRFI